MPAPLSRNCELILDLLARFYVLVRPQIQQLVFPGHKQSRATRTYLTRLFKAGYIGKARHVPYGPKFAPCPVYYLTDKGKQYLTSADSNSLYQLCSTKIPRYDRVDHWVAISEIQIRMYLAVQAQDHAEMPVWLNEWNHYRADGHHDGQYFLHTVLSKDPPLSCSPDFGFVLGANNVSRPYYGEADRATSSPEHVIAQKQHGYDGLWRSGRFKEQHFPGVTDTDFRVIVVTTHPRRRDQLAKAIQGKKGEHRWLFVTDADFQSDRLLYEPVFMNSKQEPRRLLVPPAGYQTLEVQLTASRNKAIRQLTNGEPTELLTNRVEKPVEQQGAKHEDQ